MTNTLYYGDNLDILRRYIADESVDLIYLDPPFNSNQSYNVLFAEHDGTKAAAQVQAFSDTWGWDEAAARAYQEVVEAGGQVSLTLQAFRTMLGASDMMAYLAMMAPRLIELRRVLKPTGSLYLHCDPTASHYLKLLLDWIFRPENFRNEIIWLRTTPKGLMTKRLPQNHDVILAYQKTASATWNVEAVFAAYDQENLDDKIDEKYSLRDPDGRRYQLTALINPNRNRPNLTYEFLGVTRVWRWTKERMQAAYDAGLIVQTGPGRVPRFKRYLDEQRGRPLGSVWIDIPPVNSQAQERLGYPTQKPEELLKRIVRLSTTPHDIVLDPFCGCGTAIAAAESLDRRWIGIDITHLAINLVRHRLHGSFGKEISYQVIGEPKDLSGAEELATSEPFQFQWWALGLVGARPAQQKKGADRGIDGRLFFHDEGSGGSTKQIVFSVKAGKVSVSHVRDLVGVLDREKAAIGVLISMQEPTREMRKEAASAGFYASPWGTSHPRVQLVTIAELLADKRVDYPPTQANVTLKRAPKSDRPGTKQSSLFGE